MRAEGPKRKKAGEIVHETTSESNKNVENLEVKRSTLRIGKVIVVNGRTEEKKEIDKKEEEVEEKEDLREGKKDREETLKDVSDTARKRKTSQRRYM